jgi:cob(I)alamin adenosyltransferase
MKIYSKTGDEGITSIMGGKKVSKSDVQIEAYGSVDELISFIGLLHDHIKNDKDIQLFLLNIQNKLMLIASILSYDANATENIPEFSKTNILELEKEIDRLDNSLPPLKTFILPGGHPAVSMCHVVRTVCRRTERKVISMALNLYVSDEIKKYLNRLSDYLFVLARYLAKELSVEEIEWYPEL